MKSTFVLVVMFMAFLSVGWWWDSGNMRISAQEPPTSIQNDGAESEAQHECRDDPSGPNCPPYGKLRASPTTIDIGQETQVTAYNLFNVGGKVNFALSGPLRFNRACADTALADSGNGSNIRGGTAKTKVYGCAPGGSGTIRLKTRDGMVLDSINIIVNQTSEPYGELSTSPTAINIGGSSRITAYDLRNFGKRVKFELIGPLHYERNCGESDVAAASARALSEEPRVVYTARLTVYGCHPGGVGIVRLKTLNDEMVDTITIKINPGTEPYGELMATSTSIEIGAPTNVVAFKLFNVGKHVRFVLSGPIAFNQVCAETARVQTPDASSSDSGGIAQYKIYGCLPGGTATVKLFTTNDYKLLDTITIDVKLPPNYAPLIPAPDPGALCAGLIGYDRRKVSEATEFIPSAGGYTHVASIEIWQSLVRTIEYGPYLEPRIEDGKSRCIEVRVTSKSSPGASRSSWRGLLYQTLPELSDPSINIEGLIKGDFNNFIQIFNNPDPKIDGILIHTIQKECLNCKGGTIQTQQHTLPAGIFRHYSLHLFSKHDFDINGFSQSIELQTTHTVSGRTAYDGQKYLSDVLLELNSIFVGYSLDKLIELARRIVEWVRP